MNSPMDQIADKKSQKSLRPFFTLWGGQAISLFGSQMVQFALIWWLTQETGSATILAAASLVGLLPQVILGPFVGVLVDRWPRRWVMFVADSLVALASLLLAYLFWSGAVEIWHVFALLFIRALGGAFHWPAMQASTPLMVPAEQLTRIQGLNQMLQGGMSIVAAPLGALLVSLLTMPALLMIDVTTALFAIVPLLFIMVPQPKKADTPANEDGAASKTSFWTEMRLGFRYILSWPAVLMLMGMAMLINFLLTPLAALQPILVTQHFQGEAIHLGILEAAFGVGIVAGGILLGVWGGFQKRVYTSLVGFLVRAGSGNDVLAGSGQRAARRGYDFSDQWAGDGDLPGGGGPGDAGAGVYLARQCLYGYVPTEPDCGRAVCRCVWRAHLVYDGRYLDVDRGTDGVCEPATAGD